MKIESYSPTIRRKEMDAVLTTLVGEKVGPGEQGTKLIQVAKEHIGFDYCLALRSPVTALSLALKALDLPDESAVIVSALSPAYYIEVLNDLRLRALFCDVDELSASMNPETIQSLLSQGARAIVVHHALGYISDLPAIVELGLPVIEDCSRSFGSNWLENRTGAFGTFTILGLEERDMLTAGGGALLYATNRREGSVLRKYADISPEYQLPDMNAALALVQFKEAERNYQKRKEIAAIYLQSSLRTRHKRLVQMGEAEYNNYAFPVILDTGAKDARSYAVKKDVHVDMAFSDTLIGKELVPSSSCPVAYSLSLRTLVFPLYPRLTNTQVAKVAKVLATLP
ncbi:DegT/DnrJ/EryC1/StrS family aminotransferase [Treponema sp.]